MEVEQILSAVLLVSIILLLNCYLKNKTKREGFSLSNRPMETENSMLHRNPYDHIDYITPTFKMIGR